MPSFLFIIKCGISLILLLYVAILAFIPAVELFLYPGFILAGWLLFGLACFGAVEAALFFYTPKKVALALAGFILWHAGLYLPPVALAFEKDICADRGGAWRNNTCQTEEIKD